MHQRRQGITADDQLEREKAGQAEFAQQPSRFPHMHQPGLHPAFEPARVLAQPGAETRRGLLVSGGIDNVGAIAETRQPHAEIGIFRDVVGIPSAGFAQNRGAEMVR